MRWLMIITFSVGMLAGCNSEDAQITLHQAGVYHGKPDGMSDSQMQALAQQKREEILAERFTQIQTDR